MAAVGASDPSYAERLSIAAGLLNCTRVQAREIIAQMDLAERAMLTDRIDGVIEFSADHEFHDTLYNGTTKP